METKMKKSERLQQELKTLTDKTAIKYMKKRIELAKKIEAKKGSK